MTTLTGGTLCIDIGGSHLKAMVVDPTGQPIHDRVRLETPRPATPGAVLKTLTELVAMAPAFERVSAGFPGVVIGGVVHTAPNLDGDWAGFALAEELERLTHKPARASNDADVQGLGVIEGRGVELVITFGTGMGSALFLDGRLVPNLELGHHPLRKKKTYEQYICNRALEKIGDAKWLRRVHRVIAQIQPIWNPRVLYLGGGNARKLVDQPLPENVRVVDNVAGILGGIRLWSRTE